MFGEPFYHALLKKYTIVLGSLFNNLSIKRYDDAGNYKDTLRVPLQYGPRQRFLERLTNDPELRKPAAIRLPRMAFMRSSMSYEGDRKLPDSGRIRAYDSTSGERTTVVWNPVAYRIDYDLYIAAKTVEDGEQIVEQILPYFTPEWHVNIRLLEGFDNTEYKIPITLTSVSYEDSVQGNYDDDRVIMWTLTFSIKGYLFGPVRKSAIIKLANTNLYVPATPTAAGGVGNTEASSRITIVPGLTPQGEPTSNSAQSIDRSLIDFDDNYGYIVTIEFLE